MNERLEQYIGQLSPPELQTYAREYWAYMQGKGQYPQPGKLGERDAQQVRIRLAQLG